MILVLSCGVGVLVVALGCVVAAHQLLATLVVVYTPIEEYPQDVGPQPPN